ncbi:MAG TPA: molybdenum cofactor guanylyltransferase [Pyrinomonadaceae bacterium]|nr:molybdenum cofactor guanylyltransferase [Pyrinomonadaceae bacterium]
MFDVEGFILVGGASRRMGRDKAQLVLGGRTFVERIANELAFVASSLSLVGARSDFPSLKTIADVHEHWGALGGIHAALTAAETDWVVVVACDLPFVTTQLFAHLKNFADDTFDAIVPIQSDGRPQPVCALYRRATCLPEIDKLVAVGEHTPRGLLANVRTRYVEFVELCDLPAAEHFFFNVNSPADLKKAQAILSRQ